MWDFFYWNHLDFLQQVKHRCDRCGGHNCHWWAAGRKNTTEFLVIFYQRLDLHIKHITVNNTSFVFTLKHVYVMWLIKKVNTLYHCFPSLSNYSFCLFVAYKPNYAASVSSVLHDCYLLHPHFICYIKMGMYTLFWETAVTPETLNYAALLMNN